MADTNTVKVDQRSPAASQARAGLQRDRSRPPPRVSIIMGTYNGSRFIRQSIDSILTQTWSDLELIVADDCSTDDTSSILASIADPRLIVIRNTTNCGVVESRNRCFEQACGEYVAMLDHDDLSHPTRLAKQIAYLDLHPETVLVGTDSHSFEAGQLIQTKHPRKSTPALLTWLLYVANPLICSSIMFRASAARRLESLMRKGFDYADDYDLYHRIRSQGEIARLDESLTLYRLHSSNTFRRHENIMIENAVRVLAPEYERWFGSESEAAALLIVRHLSSGKPVPDAATLRKLALYFDHLNKSYIAENGVGESDRAAIECHASELWRRMLNVTIRQASISRQELTHAFPSTARGTGRTITRMHWSRLQAGRIVRRLARSYQKQTELRERRAPSCLLMNTEFVPLAHDADRPPTLYVVVDTEAEFDWGQPFARSLTQVTAMDDIERGQEIFDRYGLRPIYVTDYPVVSCDRSAGRLDAILKRGGCEIGAHLHPWTTPPFDEQISNRNSYPGNLPDTLEARKLKTLIEAIRSRFGVDPLFYKAGRYGFGPSTARTLARQGIKVDLSVMPGADLRRRGGPDFRGLLPVPYRLGESGIITVPMTRDYVGLLPALGPVLETISQNALFKPLRLRAVLSRLGIVDIITLTPEGIAAADQIRLVNALLKRGNNVFVLHFHSPSLSPGKTPYARTESDVREFIGRMRDFCQFFFGSLGGLPGHPRTLLPTS